MEEVIAYKCEHCGKISLQKAYIKQHEKKCYHNPETKSCATCKYLIFGTMENPLKPGYFDEQFQSCRLGLDVKFKHLKTDCIIHELHPEYDDEIEDFIIFRGPHFIESGQPGYFHS